MRALDRIVHAARNLRIPFLARYAAAGSAAALVYVSIYYGLAALMHAPSLPSSWLAFGVSLVVQYSAHARFSFRSQLVDLRQGMRFAGATLIGLAASSTIAFVGPRLGWPPILTAGVVVAIVPPLNLVLLAGWVFAARRAKRGEPSSAN